MTSGRYTFRARKRSHIFGIFTFTLGCFALAVSSQATESAASAERDSAQFRTELQVRQADYWRLQGRHFTALGLLTDTEPGTGEVSRAATLLGYGLPQEAHALLMNRSSLTPVPPELWLNLADAYLRRGDFDAAERTIGNLPADPEWQGERNFLLGQIHYGRKRYADAAALWNTDYSDPVLRAYARFNLAAVLHKLDKDAEAVAALDALIRETSLDPEVQAVRERALLTLGQAALRAGDGARAKAYFALIRSRGPLASAAAEGTARAALQTGDINAAVESWSRLAAQDDSYDPPVQEAWIGLPAALSAAGEPERAIRLYQEAQSRLTEQVTRLRAARVALMSGEALQALVQAEPHEVEPDEQWRLERVPASPAGAYLRRLIADPALFEALKNYRNLRATQKMLARLKADAAALSTNVPQRVLDATRVHRDNLERRRDELEGRVMRLAERFRRSVSARADMLLQAEETRLVSVQARARLGLGVAYARLGEVRRRASRPEAGALLQRATETLRALVAQNAAPSLRRPALLQLARLEWLQAQVGGAAARAHEQAALHYYHAVLDMGALAPGNDVVLYHVAQLHEHAGDDQAFLAVLARLAQEFPASQLFAESQFRRAERLYKAGRHAEAADVYQTIAVLGSATPFYARALYKQGWALYLEDRTEDALNVFHTLLENGLAESRRDMARGDDEQTADIFRVISMAHMRLGGVDAIQEIIGKREQRPSYERRLYYDLAEMYLAEGSVKDAAASYRRYVQLYPLDLRSAQFLSKLIDAYVRLGYTAEAVAAKGEFVELYQPGAAYWQQADAAGLTEILPLVRAHLTDLTEYYHARLRRQQTQQDLDQARRWYDTFLHAFSQDRHAPRMQFLYAEMLFDAGAYGDAAREYERVAYEMPNHEQRIESGYAAILAYRAQAQMSEGPARAMWFGRAAASGQRFAQFYASDPRVPAVLARVAEDLYAAQNLAAATALARQLLGMGEKMPSALRRTAWLVLGHSALDQENFPHAEQAYTQAAALAATPAERADTEELLAAAVYQQGTRLAATSGAAAAEHYLRVKQVAPSAKIAALGYYDAAALLLQGEQWAKAIEVLGSFARDYPQHPLTAEAQLKLAYAHERSGDLRAAANLYSRLAQARSGGSRDVEMTWKAAELFDRAGARTEAQSALLEYLERGDLPLEVAQETRSRVAAYYALDQDHARRRAMLQRIVEAEALGRGQTERSRYLAAHAALALADYTARDFYGLRLSEPLAASLRRKKEAMEKSLADYARAADYGVAAVATAATYCIAQLYGQFAGALLLSERPKSLSGEELLQYNVLLEEQAFPFEERAIALHETNAARASGGVYDEWVRKSFDALGQLVPARYAKTEKAERYYVEAAWP